MKISHRENVPYALAAKMANAIALR